MTISAEAAKITERCVWIEMLEAGIFSKKGWAESINWEVEKKDRERHKKRECECFDGKCMFVKLQEAGLLDAGWSKVYLTELMRKHNEKECKCYKQEGGNKMTKVFQVFNLNFEELDKVEDKKLFGLNPPEAVKNLIQELKTKGYEVLEGSISHSGIPTSLIVGTELFPNQDLKLDFYSIADRLGLRWFISGEVYLETA